MTQAVVALFDDYRAAQDAVQDLVTHGFAHDNISFVARDHEHDLGTELNANIVNGAANGAGMGAALGGLAGLLVGLGSLAIPGTGPIIAAGPLAAALAGAGVGAVAGGLVGALVDSGVPSADAPYYAEGVRRGGSLVCVSAAEHLTGRAREILDRHGATDIKTRAEEWRAGGWNPTAGDAGTYQEEGEPSRPPAGDTAAPPRDEQQTTPGYGDVRTAGSPYGGAEYKGTERSGATYSDNPELSHQPDTAKRTGPQEQGLGYSSGAGQSGAGFQGAEQSRPGLVSARDFDSFDQDFRGHHDLLYHEGDYQRYQPAYRYGYDLAGNERYRGHKWSDIESEARRDWEQRYPNEPWDNVSAAVRHAWERAAGAGGPGPANSETGNPSDWHGTDARANRPSYQGPEERRI